MLAWQCASYAEGTEQFAGRLDLRVRGHPPACIRAFFAETLNDDDALACTQLPNH